MSRRSGVVIGRVERVDDPEGEGRVQFSLPWMGGNPQCYWAPVATLMGGGGRGTWFMPEKGDEVLVCFEQEDVNHPYIVGFLHNGAQRPPETNPKHRVIHSVNGHQLVFRDSDPAAGDMGGITIRDAHGNEIELGNARISIRALGFITIDAPSVFINGRLVTMSSPFI